MLFLGERAQQSLLLKYNIARHYCLGNGGKMKLVENNKRISMLGLVKFLAALAILIYHIRGGYVHGGQTYLLVEFFFFITGYFTFRHFRKKGVRGKTREEKSKNAITYTIKKFLPMLPFIIFALILKYITLFLVYGKGGNILEIARTIPFNFLLLGSQVNVYTCPLWFLSAMIIVFPVFSYICQTKHKNTLYIAAFAGVIVYYFNFFLDHITGVNALIRAFFGMFTGILIYALSEYIRGLKSTGKLRALLLAIEILSFAIIVLGLYPSIDSNGVWYYTRISLIFYVFYLSVLLSGKTITSKISSPLMDYLERLSMIVYMIHFPIIRLVGTLIIPGNSKRVIILVAAISIVSSIILNFVVSFIKKRHIVTKRN